MAWPPVHQAEGAQQSDAVPSAVQQRAAQYAGDEGLARPPTRPPSDWQSRQAQTHGEEALVSTSNRDALSSDRCLLLRNTAVNVQTAVRQGTSIGREQAASWAALSVAACTASSISSLSPLDCLLVQVSEPGHAHTIPIIASLMLFVLHVQHCLASGECNCGFSVMLVQGHRGSSVAMFTACRTARPRVREQ